MTLRAKVRQVIQKGIEKTVARKPQLFLHIGHPKTASSTIQQFLFENWQAVRQADYLMPTGKFTLSSSKEPPANPLWALEEMRSNQDITPLRNWIEAALAHPTFAGKLLVSSESLAQPDWPGLLAGLQDRVDVHLIYYIRRQDQLLLSAWRQWGLKRGLSLDAFLTRRCRNKQPNFLEILERWAEHTSPASHHVRFIQPPFLKNGQVLDDLCHHLGLNTGPLTRVTDQNISVDARLCLFLAKHPELFTSVHDEEIFTLLRKDAAEPDIRLSWNETQFLQIQAAFEPTNQQLLQQYHPDYAGTPVIDPETAKLDDMTSTIPPSQQVAYIKKCLSAQPKGQPKIDQLRHILMEEYGEENV